MPLCCMVAAENSSECWGRNSVPLSLKVLLTVKYFMASIYIRTCCLCASQTPLLMLGAWDRLPVPCSNFLQILCYFRVCLVTWRRLAWLVPASQAPRAWSRASNRVWLNACIEPGQTEIVFGYMYVLHIWITRCRIVCLFGCIASSSNHFLHGVVRIPPAQDDIHMVLLHELAN
jgi:hypothetical protein